MTRGGEGASSLPIILSVSLHLSKVQQGLRIKNQDSTATDGHASDHHQPSQVLISEE